MSIRSSAKHYSLPDLHRSSSLLLLLVLAQIVATILWLLQGDELALSWYALCSFYMHAVVLLVCSVLGLIRRFIAKQPFFRGACIFVVTFVICCVAIELVAQLLLNRVNGLDGERFFRLGVASFLISLLCARVSYLMQVLRERSQAEVQSKVDALQARINPHFLFNSLNSISELTCTEPARAEEAIQSLAMLFRVSLEGQGGQHSLSNELLLCRRFVELEAWRFEQGLHIDYSIACAEPEQWRVPKLILQPLIENAIKYGVADDVEKPIKLDVSESRQALSLKISNFIAVGSGVKHGNGMATENIKDRLFMLYDDQYTFSCRTVDDQYYVLMQIPKEPIGSNKG